MKLASFDVFDTTLIRKYGSPRSSFFLLGKALDEDDPWMQEAFIDWRSRRETEIQKKLSREIALQDIYFERDMFPGGYSQKAMLELEENIESSQLVANKTIQTIISQKREEGYQICFISDMYLSSSFLKKVLIREHCASESDEVFVSCEYGKRKSTGELYDLVRQRFNPSIWEHYGDNRHSDFDIAKKHNINAHLISPNFTAAESHLRTFKPLFREKDLFDALLGCSRTVRLINGDTPEARLAADFVAPVYIPYVQFVIDSAKKKGIKRLYFLARDGYILYKIAKVLAKGEDIELRYLYVSRQALLPAFIASYPNVADYLKTQWGGTVARNLIVNKILERHFLTSREELKDHYNIIFSYDRIRSKDEEKDFLGKVFHSDYTQELINRAGSKYDLLSQYFLQEGLYDDNIDSAMVDVGWLGSTRFMINELLKIIGKSTFFYYFGAEEKMRPQSDGQYIVYHKDSNYSIPLIENYFSAAPHESTTGYNLDPSSNLIVPIFAQRKDPSFYSVALANIAVAEYMASLVTGLRPVPASMLYFWMEESLKTISFSSIHADLTPLLSLPPHSGEVFVKKLNLKEVLQILLFDKFVSDFNKGSLQMSLPGFIFKRLYPIQQKMAVFHMKLYRFLRRR